MFLSDSYFFVALVTLATLRYKKSATASWNKKTAKEEVGLALFISTRGHYQNLSNLLGKSWAKFGSIVNLWYMLGARCKSSTVPFNTRFLNSSALVRSFLCWFKNEQHQVPDVPIILPFVFLLSYSQFFKRLGFHSTSEFPYVVFPVHSRFCTCMLQ